MNQLAERYFEKDQKWQDEYRLLRDIVRGVDLLTEDFKWMHPCYTFNHKNIVLIHGFKEYCALLFPKGALLADPEKRLVQQTNYVQSARQMRFQNTEDINECKADIIQFIQQAIQVEQSGKKVALKQVSNFPVPEEFKAALNKDKNLKEAFNALTPGRQKAYLFFFNNAKQSDTRTKRIEKCYEKIINGKGLND